MNEHSTIGVAIAGTGFISEVHIKALSGISDVRVRAIYGRNAKKADAAAKAAGIPKAYSDYDRMLADPETDVVVLGLPNYQHANFALRAFDAGKHVICEKPLATNLEDAAAMVRSAKDAKLVLGYAEELVFVPKFRRAVELSARGIGRIYHARQVEKHDGPYSPWFFAPETAGGGCLMDMGCHSMEMLRFAMGKQKIEWVQAYMNTVLHNDKTKMEDHVIIMMGFEDGSLGQAEASWALKGGMDSVLEIFGTKGVVYADLLKGMGLKAYSEDGFENMWEPNQGWTHPNFEWDWENGYPQEDRHFLDCVRTGAIPAESGEDGFSILELIYAAYHSAATGRRVYLPFRPANIPYAVDLWLNPRPDLGEGRINEVAEPFD